MIEAPIRVSQRDGSAHRFLANIIEEPATDHFANLGFIVYQQILGDTLDDLGNSLLPLRVPLGHLDLAARQADNGCAPGRASHSDGQVLDESMKTVRPIPVTIEVAESLVEKNQHRTACFLDDTPDDIGTRRRRSGFLAAPYEIMM
jgi:hypothetical protein